jgi:hypothetical protein
MANSIIIKVTLTPSFELTTEHAASSYGQPVLFNRQAGSEAYGPGDIVQCYPSWPLQPAAMAVERMAKTKTLTLDERLFVDKFINFGK